MKRKALYPGSFDPITLGHTDIINRSLSLFDTIYIAVGTNTSKKYLYDKDTRAKMIETLYGNEPKVEVVPFEGLTVDLCHSLDCQVILRGVRSTIDLEYEKAIAHSNKKLSNELETIFLLSSPEFSHISSSIVRELIKNKANIQGFVPEEIKGMM